MSQDETGHAENYRVVFLGISDASEANVQAFAEKLSIRFGIAMEKALRITQNPPVVVKRGLSRSKAERYEQVFSGLGGRIRIEEIDGGPLPRNRQPSVARVEGFETTAVESPESHVGKPALRSHGPGLASDETIAKAYDDDIAGAYEESFVPETHTIREVQGVASFRCPQCGQEQQKGVECVRCGIIFEKYERMAAAKSQVQEYAHESPAEGEPTPEPIEITIEPAGFWVRLGAYVVDGVLVNLLLALVAVGLLVLLGMGRDPRAFLSMGPLAYGATLLLPLAYHVYFLGKKGATPGKGFLGLQVIRRDGSGLSYGDGAIRTISYVVSSIPVFLGFIWIAFDRNKLGWHDRIARTQVIKAEDVSAWRKWIVLVPAILIPLLGIGGSVGMPVYVGYASRADVARAVSEMQIVKNHLEEHFYRYNRYPLSGEFASFVRRSLGHVPVDPFNKGRPYQYKSDGLRFTLWSIGPDRVDNNAIIPYDPLLVRGFGKKGDIVLYSDQGADTGGETPSITPSSF